MAGPCAAGTPADGPVGRPVHRHQGPPVGAARFALLPDEIPGARLEVLGDGPLRNELERLAGRLGVSGSVCFRGLLPWPQTLGAYDEADVLLFTSLRDSFGVQNLEAWARGVPVVHLDHQGVRGLLRTGLRDCGTAGRCGGPAAASGPRARRGAHRPSGPPPQGGGRAAVGTTAHLVTEAKLAEQLYETVVNRR
ncbi:glycosyltransferase [Streptomyces sp. ICN441]|nr:glycosyltransferase [Streptomyces sp. ICN441]